MVATKEIKFTHHIKVGENILHLTFNKEYTKDDIISYIINNIYECDIDNNDIRNILFYKLSSNDGRGYRSGMDFWFEFKEVDTDIDINSSLTDIRNEFIRLYRLQEEKDNA